MFTRSFYSKSIFTTVAWVIIGFMIAALLYLLTRWGLKKGAFKLIIFIIVIGFCYYSGYKNKYAEEFNAIISGILIFIIINLLYGLALTYLHIPQWDFMCFYLFGKVGLASTDFYNPVISAQVFNSDLHLQIMANSTFIDEIVKVGFWYPPPSMFLFLPLGLFDVKTSYVIWQSIVIFFLVVDIILIIRYYKLTAREQYKFPVKASLITTTLVLLFPDIISSILFSQTVSIFLFLLLMLIRNINNSKSGIFLALLVVIKPLAIFLALYFFVTRKWKPVFAFAATGLVILTLTVLCFGFHPLVNFIISPPTGRMGAYVFTEEINQSLNSVLLRAHNNSFENVDLKYFRIAFYFLSFCVVMLTIYSSRLLSKISEHLSFIIYIPMAMMLYPAALYTYMIILMPVVLSMFNQKLFKNNLLNLLMMFLLYGIGFYNMFLFNLFLWVSLVTWPLLLKHTSDNKAFYNWFRFNSTDSLDQIFLSKT